MIVSSKKIFYFAQALRYPSFALLWAGQVVSELGDGAFDVALAWKILLLTGSATAMGLIMTAETLPRVLFFLLGGVAADRFPRRMILLVSDIGRAAVVFLIALLAGLNILQLWHLIVLALFFGVVKGFFRPAFRSISPQLVEKETLQSANSLITLTEQLGLLLGPLIGSLLIVTTGVTGAFTFNALTFVCSAVCFLLLRLNPSIELARKEKALAKRADGTEKKGVSGVFTNIAEGFRYVGSIRWLWVSILVASVGNICFLGPLVVVLPKLVTTVYKSNVVLLGAVNTAGGLGTIVGLLLTGQFMQRGRRGLFAYLAMLLSSLALISFGLPLPAPFGQYGLILADALVGLGVGAFGVVWMTVIQEMVPGDKLGRVVSIDMVGSYCLMPIGYALAGVLADSIGPAWIYIAAGLINCLLAALALLVRDIRKME